MMHPHLAQDGSYYVLTQYKALRHTHASLMLQSNVHPKIVSERLGHASVAITMDIYSHVLPGLQEEAAQRFAKLLHDPSD